MAFMGVAPAGSAGEGPQGEVWLMASASASTPSTKTTPTAPRILYRSFMDPPRASPAPQVPPPHAANPNSWPECSAPRRSADSSDRNRDSFRSPPKRCWCTAPKIPVLQCLAGEVVIEVGNVHDSRDRGAWTDRGGLGPR